MRARNNPFAVDRVLALRTRLPPGESWEGLLDRFETLGRRAALIGPHGAGKTTLLEDLEPRLAERGLRLHKVTLRAGEHRLGNGRARALFEGLEKGDLLLVDGAEQLAPWAWQALRWRARRAAGLLITCHQPGRLPTLLDCRTSPELLAALLVELVGPAETAALPVAELFARHGGDLRAVLRGLYDVWALER